VLKKWTLFPPLTSAFYALRICRVGSAIFGSKTSLEPSPYADGS